MDAFVWDQNFITGLTDMDDQHQVLIGMFNSLNQALETYADGTDNQALEESFDLVVTYARYHFAEEELLMRQKGVDERHVREHARLHAEFIEQACTLWAARSAMNNPAELFVGFLANWLGLHILGVDQAMTRQIQRVAQGCSAADAYAQEAGVHDPAVRALIGMVGRLYRVLTVQNAELARSYQQLERRVQQRTRELAEANERLEAVARTDGLLQIANRGYFDERLAAACASAQRHGQPLGVLLIDVDFFKRYNDHYGHLAGDACLQAIARAIAQALPRQTDLVARYGGEELVVLLPDTDAQGTAVVAERVVAAVQALSLPHSHSDAAPCVTVSVGAVTLTPMQSDVATELLGAADAALYRAKAAGRNGWQMG